MKKKYFIIIEQNFDFSSTETTNFTNVYVCCKNLNAKNGLSMKIFTIFQPLNS